MAGRKQASVKKRTSFAVSSLGDVEVREVFNKTVMEAVNQR